MATMSDMHADHLIRMQSHVLAPIERVFEAWSVPSRLREWYPESATGEFRVGGRVRFEWSSLALDLDLELLELEPNRRIAFCGDPGSGAQVQSVELEPTETGTRMTIEHTGFVTAGDADGARSGWTLGGAMLDEYLTRHYATERTCFAVLSTTSASPAQVFDAFRTPGWLCDEPPTFDRARADVAMTLASGMHVTGCVLALSQRGELLLRCDQIAGIVALRAFTTAGMVLFGAQVTSWGPARAETDQLRAELAAGIERLATSLGGPVTAA